VEVCFSRAKAARDLVRRQKRPDQTRPVPLFGTLMTGLGCWSSTAEVWPDTQNLRFSAGLEASWSNL